MRTVTHTLLCILQVCNVLTVCVCVCVCVQTDIEISKEEDFARILQMEEEYIQQICEDIIRLKPDLIFTEKGISGTQQHTTIHTHTHTLLSERNHGDPRPLRSGSALPGEGQHHRHPPSEED